MKKYQRKNKQETIYKRDKEMLGERNKQELNISFPKANTGIRGKTRVLGALLMVLMIIIFTMGSTLAVFSRKQ